MPEPGVAFASKASLSRGETWGKKLREQEMDNLLNCFERVYNKSDRGSLQVPSHTRGSQIHG
jgi:hypothetical protein